MADHEQLVELDGIFMVIEMNLSCHLIAYLFSPKYAHLVLLHELDEIRRSVNWLV